MEKNCDTCKYYSRLHVVDTGFAECHFCQANHCVYCENHGVKCKDYEFGENDGGKRDYEYDDEEE